MFRHDDLLASVAIEPKPDERGEDVRAVGKVENKADKFAVGFLRGGIIGENVDVLRHVARRRRRR